MDGSSTDRLERIVRRESDESQMDVQWTKVVAMVALSLVMLQQRWCYSSQCCCCCSAAAIAAMVLRRYYCCSDGAMALLLLQWWCCSTTARDAAMLWRYGAAARDVATLQHCGVATRGNDRQQRTMQRWRAALVMVGSALLLCNNGRWRLSKFLFFVNFFFTR